MATDIEELGWLIERGIESVGTKADAQEYLATIERLLMTATHELRALQWSDPVGGGICPRCANDAKRGHESDCPIGGVLRDVEGA